MAEATVIQVVTETTTLEVSPDEDTTIIISSTEQTVLVSEL